MVSLTMSKMNPMGQLERTRAGREIYLDKEEPAQGSKHSDTQVSMEVNLDIKIEIK